MTNILRLAFIMLILSFTLTSSAQETPLRQEQSTQRSVLVAEGIFSQTKVENIGPTIFGGRIVDLDVNPENPHEFYVAYASGGLWHTENNGSTFNPIFDHESVMTIGDIAVNWTTRKIYVGTGEVNSSRSSYAGVGIYTSSDNGATWEYLGLPESHHIGRIVLHKENPDIINVAVLGHLYTPNNERGVYHTEDGGQSWSLTLFINENAGAVDLISHPQDANTLYTAIWERTRRAWNFTESGAGSGIYKSTDGGLTWTMISSEESGFPTGEGTGRIGLSVASRGDTTYLYAILDNYNRRPPEKDTDHTKLKKEDFVDMSTEDFARLNDKKLTAYLESNRIKDYSTKEIKKLVAEGKVKPIALKEYVEDANSLLFDTPVIGAEVYSTIDDGTSWKKTHDSYLDGLYNSYGYYFGQIRVSPDNPDILYIMGVPILRSDDRGQHWKNINGENVHVDHHALWINPNNPSHIINGNDGGLNISYDKGENWEKPTSPAVGQFYYVIVDQGEDYKVYGGTQDNGVWVGNANYEEGVRWQMFGKYPYKKILGGDGMQIQIDNRDNNTVYTGYQFGNYFRVDSETGDRTYITPKHKLGDRPYRWNWQSPILLSTHNQDIVYFGANKLMRSMDKGETFVEISDELTHGGKIGDVAFGTLTTISESSFTFGLIYTGSDDGRVHVTRDGGFSWSNIDKSLPDSIWVSRIVASAHDTSRVYVTLNGYRNDRFAPYIYVSDDYGDTWEDISNNLPHEPINVVKEDPISKDILYVGTDHGTYISTDRGLSYMKLGGDMPSVPVHDLVVHKETKDLIIGTHGRSIYKVNLALLHEVIGGHKELVISTQSDIRFSKYWGYKRGVYDEANVPEHEIAIFSTMARSGKLSVLAGKKEIYSTTIDIPKGISTYTYDLSIDHTKSKVLTKYYKKHHDDEKISELGDDGRSYLLPGEYTINIKSGNITVTHDLNIE